MRVVVFCHSLASCWNHGNAHFLRGVVSDMIKRGFSVKVFEPADGWSAANLCQTAGRAALRAYRTLYPHLRSTMYLPGGLDLDEELHDADLVIVHEWNDPELVAAIGRHRRDRGRYSLLFHDTHHRGVTAPHEMAAYDLSGYDGVLAFGEVLRELYLKNGWARNVWTWHEAADTDVFRPLPQIDRTGDLVWVGNWGDGERAEELSEFLLTPVRELQISAKVFGVRYPAAALDGLLDAGIEYGGWLPNHRVPVEFARHRMTVHIPRRPYVQALAGIPTIRPFEAMACGIPLISGPWRDREGLFAGGDFYVSVTTGNEARDAMLAVIDNPAEAEARAERARQMILARHTCRHRVDELLAILSTIRAPRAMAL